MRHSGFGLLAALLLGAPAAGQARARRTSDLVTTEKGTIPILITAPHGGDQPIPNVAKREDQSLGRDTGTYEIATELAAHLKDALGGKVYLVAARFQRGYIDANRAPEKAYDDEDARPYYDEFHDAIRAYVKEIRQKWPGRGILIDIHCQPKHEDLVRGTRDGSTCKGLLARCGDEALIGPDSIFGQMAKMEYTIVPDNVAPGKEPLEPRDYNGGYIVATYGSMADDGIDAIQLEFFQKLCKDDETRAKISKDLAKAVAAFYRKYVAAKDDDD